MAVGVEINHEAAEILVLAFAAHHGDGATIEIAGSEGIVLRDTVARLQHRAGLGHDGARTAGHDDVNVAHLGGEEFLVVHLLELGRHDDLVATGGDQGIDGGLEMGGQGVDVVGAGRNHDRALRAGHRDQAGRRDAGKVGRGHTEHADFFAAAFDDGGFGEFGVGRRGADARIVLIRMRGEGAGVPDRARVTRVQGRIGAEVQVRAKERKGRSVVTHGCPAGLGQR